MYIFWQLVSTLIVVIVNHCSILDLGAQWITICLMITLLFVCSVISWVNESIIQALMNLCVHYVMFDLMSLLTQHSLFALSSFIIHLLTHCSRVSFIVTLKFLSLSLNIFLSWVFIFEHESFEIQELGFKNQWSKFFVCVLCNAKLLIWIFYIAINTHNIKLLVQIFLWHWKNTWHQAPRLDLLYETISTHDYRLLIQICCTKLQAHTHY